MSVSIPKEKDSREIGQVPSIALLNVDGKIFFSVLARRMANFLLENGFPGFPGCVEQSSVIWEQIQRGKRKRSDLHVVWLDMANAYGSVAHQLIDYATEFFHMPNSIRSLVSNYFNELQMAFSLQEFTTGWQQLEVGIAMGCSVSPILFEAAFEVILIAEENGRANVLDKDEDQTCHVPKPFSQEAS